MRPALQGLRVLLVLAVPGLLLLAAINHDAGAGRVLLVFGLMLLVALLLSAISSLLARLDRAGASRGDSRS